MAARHPDRGGGWIWKMDGVVVMKCERCGGEACRDEVNVGVGVIYGPWGCSYCGWSEDPDYDITIGGGFQPNGSYRDPQGGIWPASNPVIRLMVDSEDTRP